MLTTLRSCPPSVLEVTLSNCHDTSAFAGLETTLKGVAGVRSVHLDRTRGVAHLGYDPHTASQTELEGRLRAAGYACDCADCQPSVTQPGQPAVGHEGHAARKAESQAAIPAEMDHDAHAGHGESMVNDMPRRLAVSLLLTPPTLLYSPIGALVGFTARHPLA
ncbi:hypothetical protein [Deinococcus sp.]|uniref:hypothetical protein n=1 Tax=Deinococcus sp. TaxID=47478 RepID=UPI003C7A27FA